MRNVSAAFMRALSADKRDWNNRAVITLADNTVLNLDNEDIWDDGVSIEDAVSRDNVFDVGAAIINQAKLVINNIYDTYSTYDFTGAKVVLYTGLSDLDDGSTEEIKLGTYTVDEAQYNGSIITLTCLDNMYKFDEAYDTSLIYPATLGEIVRDCCTNCGVTMDNASLQFPHYDYVVDAKPSGESTTYRQVISWAAQIAGCFARCNANGYLTIKWYDTAALDEILQNLDGGIFDNGTPKYITGDSADGGSFNPWNTGAVYDGGALNEARKVHQISSDYSCHISTDDVVITGVKVVKKVVSEDTQSDFEEYTSGSAGYVISIEDNDLIQGTHGQDIANWLGTALIGLVFRKAEITHPSNPSIEAGDVALYWDRKANYYSIIVSSTNFTSSNSQTTRSSAETPRKNSAQRFTESTKNYVELRKRIKMQRTAWQQAEEDLIDRINNSNGLYVTEVVESGATKIYYHDKPNLNESSIVMYFSDVGFTMTSNYQDNPPTWYGMTVDGTMIAGIMNTIGINFDWGVGGALQIKKNNNETFYANADTGVVRIVADSFSLSNGDTINSIANSAASSAVNAQTQTDIFNKLTNNGQTQGIYLSNSKIYINASYISSGTFTVKKGTTTTFSANASTGVVNIVADSFSLSNGDTIDSIATTKAAAAVNAQTQQSIFNKLTNNGQTQGIYLSSSKIYINADYIATGTLADANNNTVFNLSTGALTMKKGSINIGSGQFVVDTSGNLTAKSATLNGSLRTASGGEYVAINNGIISVGSTSNNVDTERCAITFYTQSFNPGIWLRTPNSYGLFLGEEYTELSNKYYKIIMNSSNIEFWHNLGTNWWRSVYIDGVGVHPGNGTNTQDVYLPAAPISGVSYYHLKVKDGILTSAS